MNDDPIDDAETAIRLARIQRARKHVVLHGAVSLLRRIKRDPTTHPVAVQLIENFFSEHSLDIPQ